MKKFVTIIALLITSVCDAQVAQWSPINGGTIPNTVWSMYASGTTLYIGTENATPSNRLYTYNGTAPSVVSTYTTTGNRIVAIGPNQANKVGFYDANSAGNNVNFAAYDGTSWSNSYTYSTLAWINSPNNLISSGFVSLPMSGNVGSYVGGFIIPFSVYSHTSAIVAPMGNISPGGYTADMIWKGDTVFAVGNQGSSWMYYMPTSGVQMNQWQQVFNSTAFTFNWAVVRLAAVEYFQGNFYIAAYCDPAIASLPGTPHYKILRWNGSVLTDVTPSALAPITMIHDMQVFNNKLYVGGDKFIQFDGTSWTSAATITGGNVNCIGIYSGELYIGGSFTQVNGNSAMAHIARMEIINPPVAGFTTSSASICEGGSMNFTNTSTGQNITSYSWTFPGGTPGSSISQNPGPVTFNSAGNYIVQLTVTNIAGSNMYSFPITVNANPTPSVIPSGTTTFCQGDSVVLDAGSYSSYLWSNAATSQTISVSTGGSYSVTVTDGNGCVGTSSAINITVNNNPIPIITGNTSFCQGDSTLLSTQTYSTYSWSTSEITQSIYVNSSGSYSVTVTDANGCTGTDNVSITVNPLPTTPTISLSGSDLVSSSSTGNQWYLNTNIIPSATSQTYTPTANGSYVVTVTDGNGCSSSSVPYVMTTVGIDEIAPGYHTPYTVVNGMVQINVVGSWTIYDINGRTIINGNDIDIIDMSGVFLLVTKNASYKVVNLK